MHLLVMNHLINDFKIYDLLIYYVIYSFLGWCSEIVYAYKNQRKFINRGFLYGPLCPIYGACVLAVISIINNFHTNIFIMLIIATLLTSFVEYFTGFILEKLFKTKYWDYTEDPFNLHGRICLHFSIMWGAVSLIILKIVHPFIASIVTALPVDLRITISIVLLFLLILDLAKTLSSLVSLKNVLYHLQFNNNNTLLSSTPVYKGHIPNLLSDIKEKISTIMKK